MNSIGAGSGIRCPIGLYGKYEPQITQLTAEINRSSTAFAKSRAARDLGQIVRSLRECGEYDEGNLNCRMCREVATLREKTAAVVEKAGALGR